MFYKFATTLVLLVILDAIWLTATLSNSRQVFAKLQGQPLQIRWIPAVLTYLLMAAALWFFVVKDATDWLSAGSKGAGLGLAMYGLYDLTNYSTLTNYPLSFALTDIVWGSLLFGTTAGLATLI